MASLAKLEEEEAQPAPSLSVQPVLPAWHDGIPTGGANYAHYYPEHAAAQDVHRGWHGEQALAANWPHALAHGPSHVLAGAGLASRLQDCETRADGREKDRLHARAGSGEGALNTPVEDEVEFWRRRVAALSVSIT